MFLLLDFDAFETGFDGLLRGVGRDHLVEHDAQLAISFEHSGGTDLQDRTFEARALGEDEVVFSQQGRGDYGFDLIQGAFR